MHHMTQKRLERLIDDLDEKVAEVIEAVEKETTGEAAQTRWAADHLRFSFYEDIGLK